MSQDFDAVLSELLRSLEPYSAHITIGGGMALVIYREYLAKDSTAPRPAATHDVDFLLPRKFRVKEAEEGRVPPLGDLLKQKGFEWRTQSLDSPPVEVYVKKIFGQSLALEFLTDRKSRSTKDSNVSIAGISAQPLTYIEMSLGHAEVFHTKSDAVGLVVSPGAWIFHKALTFVKRKTEAKKS